MAKRFTDTDKWKKGFIKRLPAKYKLLWLYILDDCNLFFLLRKKFFIELLKNLLLIIILSIIIKKYIIYSLG